ncbi:MAG TPA: hypothetical protein VFC78_21880 [Tepidisphaeraceae bacterium]|nr:hypothetical protein [Tepidisphaeraceae bacterium]
MSLVLPAPPAWIERAALVFEAIASATQFAVPLIIIMFMRRTFGLSWTQAARALAQQQSSLIIWAVEWAFLIAVFAAIFFAQLYEHCRYAGTPTQLDIANGTVTYSRRGIWGIRFRRRPIRDVSDVTLNMSRDIFGRSPRGFLILKMRTGRPIRVALNRKAFALGDQMLRAVRAATGQDLA